MARRCLCDRLRQRIATDPLLCTLPMAAKWLWLALAERAAEHAGGVLPVGSPFGFLSGIAMLIQAAEPEIETHWETLAARGLVLRDGDSVVVPGLDVAPSRTAASRANGGLGGRPRRGETPEAARLRRSQGALLLPVTGGAEKPEETQVQKPPITTSSSESLSLAGGGKPAREVSHSALGAELAALARLDPIRQRFDYRPVVGWLAAGISPDTIRAAFVQVAEREGYEPHRISSLNYFTRAVEACHAEAAKPADRPMSERAVRNLEWIANGCDPDAYPGLAA